MDANNQLEFETLTAVGEMQPERFGVSTLPSLLTS
jgi:hypothetical protein